MARAVILRFKDNAAAEKFVRETVERGSISVLSDDPDLYTDVVPVEVAAVVAIATSHCHCASMQDDTGPRRRRRSKRDSFGWTRGGQFGWWVCPHCRKPSIHWTRHFITAMLAGCNDLLPKILGIGPPLTPNERYMREGGVGTPQLKVGGRGYEHL